MVFLSSVDDVDAVSGALRCAFAFMANCFISSAPCLLHFNNSFYIRQWRLDAKRTVPCQD